MEKLYLQKKNSSEYHLLFAQTDFLIKPKKNTNWIKVRDCKELLQHNN